MTKTAWLRALLLAALLPFSATSFGQRPTETEAEPLSSLDQSIQTSMEDWKVPGAAVSIVRGQSIVYSKGFGVRDIHTKQPVTEETLFAIGSCTKAFTSAVIAMLVDQGKMRWDGKVNAYLPFFHLYDPQADENVTIRDLLTHRTGLPGADLVWYGTTLSREELIRRVAYIAPEGGFRARFRYQNLMFLAAGQAAGQSAGTTWEDLVRSRIFEPLQMKGSATSTTEALKSTNRAVPHEQSADGSVKTVAWRDLDNVGPAGSIVSSARDMAKWVGFQLNDGTHDGKRLISEQSMREMHEPQMVVPRAGGLATLFFPDSTQLSYGLGWFVQDYRGHQLILHPGDIDGFAAMVVLIPEISAGYFIAINSGSRCRQVLAYQIADKLLNLPDAGWSARFHKLEAGIQAAGKLNRAWQSKRTPGKHPSHALSEYAGKFENPAYGKADISLETGKLVLRFHSVASDLEHFQYDTFVTDMIFVGKTRLTFSLDEQGEVDRFVVDGISFKRIASSLSSPLQGLRPAGSWPWEKLPVRQEGWNFHA